MLKQHAEFVMNADLTFCTLLQANLNEQARFVILAAQKDLTFCTLLHSLKQHAESTHTHTNTRMIPWKTVADVQEDVRLA